MIWAQSQKKKKPLDLSLGSGCIFKEKYANRKGLLMKIKDVEKLTGLTAKSIRYYESKNLITVARNEGNSYRDYTEADVNRLRWIKMFRYLDFSIEEIENLLTMDVDEIKEALRQKADTFSKQKNLCEDKQNLCLSLAKDYENGPKVVEEYNDTIELVKSDEMVELMEQLEDYAAPNLISSIIQTLIFMAPVLWLFYNIKAARVDLLMVNGIAAVAGTALTTWNWIHYVNHYQKHRARVKRKNRKMIWMVPVMIASLILGLAALIAVMVLIPELMIPNDYLFVEQGPVTGIVLIWLVMIPVILLCVLAIVKIRKKTTEEMEDTNDILFIWNHLGKWRPAAIVAWLVALYCCITNFNVVTEDKIICYSPWNPMGIEYEYSDVKSIKTGFGDKNFSIAEYKKKGNFFYQVEINGKTITFHTPSINEKIKRYEEHSYLELEEFDQALVELGIPKEADKTGWENCDFDKEYVDRFLRIIMLGAGSE